MMWSEAHKTCLANPSQPVVSLQRQHAWPLISERRGGSVVMTGGGAQKRVKGVSVKRSQSVSFYDGVLGICLEEKQEISWFKNFHLCDVQVIDQR